MTRGTVPPSCFDWEKVCTQTELDNVHRIRMVDIQKRRDLEVRIYADVHVELVPGFVGFFVNFCFDFIAAFRDDILCGCILG